MKKALFLIVFILTLMAVGHAQQVNTSRQVRNLTAFARLYGYVKHFHPSDEAQDISWYRFATHGSQQVVNAKNDSELRKILMALFTPVAPSLQLYSKAKDKKQDLAGITPPNTKGLKLTCWQYEGLMNQPRSTYSSFRTNRPFKIYLNTYDPIPISLLNFVLPDVKTDYNKTRVSFSIKQATSDTLNMFLSTEYNAQSFDDSLSTSSWERKTYVFEDVNPKIQSFNLYLSKFQEALLDSVRCEVFADNNWHTVYYNDFASDTVGNRPVLINVNCSSYANYIATNSEVNVVEIEGNKALSLLGAAEKEYTYGYMNKLFDEEVEFGEFVDKPLVKGLSCLFPLSLYCEGDHTYPAADSTKLNSLKSILKPIDLQDRSNVYNLLGGLIIYWNQLNYFYPYWQYTEVDWEKELAPTIEKTLACPDFLSYKFVLWELISKTRDGHAFLMDRDDGNKLPGIYAEPIGKQWVVTRVPDESLNLPLGSIVTHINGKPFGKQMQSKRKYFTYASEHKTDKNLFFSVMKSFPDSMATFTFKTPDKQAITKLITFKEYEGDPWFDNGKTVIRYSDDIYYLNTSMVTEEELDAMLPELATAKGIIFDMRSYPIIDINLISHLLSAPDTLKHFHIKRYIRPNEELPEDERRSPTGWSLLPKEPHLSAKVVFLSSAFSISYCESMLAEMQYNKLGTIIGQASSGTNGNINYTQLPIGLSLMWTGMFIDNPDGSRFHGIGIIPDIYVQPSIEAFVQGRDAEMDTALNYLQKELKLTNPLEVITEKK